MRHRVLLGGVMVAVLLSLAVGGLSRWGEGVAVAGRPVTAGSVGGGSAGGGSNVELVTGAAPLRPWENAAGVAGLYGTDLKGETHRLVGRTTALVLLGTECPIARKAVAGLNELAPVLAKEGVTLLAMISDPLVTREEAVKFAAECGVEVPVLFDGSGQLAGYLRPTRTPEAFVIDGDLTVRYRGRIDNSYEALGKQRAVTTSFDLREAALAVARGKNPVEEITEPVGCVFEAWAGVSMTQGAVTYTRDIAPILAANCVSCHKAGQIAPFPLTSYKDAARRASLLSEVVVSGYMPPWQAAAQEHRFADERRLSRDDIILFQRWAQLGAPEGDPADAMATAKESTSPWRLGTPDLVVEMPTAFEVPASGKDVYRAFVVPVNLPADVDVVATEFQSGAPTVVHHALIFVDTSGAARKKEAKAGDGKPGYVAFGGPGFTPTTGLGGWAPGATPAYLPEGVGKPLPKTCDVVMQIHYHPDGQARSDKSRLGLYFAKKPVSRVSVSVALGTKKIDIAPGDANYTKTMRMTVPKDVEVIGVTPHMHMLGKSMTGTATLPTGETVQLFHIPAWDFRWQDQYRYAESLKLPAGTKVEVTAVYDNSAENPANPSQPPVRVTHGEQTTDEMCLAFFQIVVPRASATQTRTEFMRAVVSGAIRDRLFGSK